MDFIFYVPKLIVVEVSWRRRLTHGKTDRGVQCHGITVSLHCCGLCSRHVYTFGARDLDPGVKGAMENRMDFDDDAAS